MDKSLLARKEQFVNYVGRLLNEVLAPFVIFYKPVHVSTRTDEMLRSLFDEYASSKKEQEARASIIEVLNKVNRSFEESCYPMEGEYLVLPDYLIYREQVLGKLKELTA